ncbi:hypothetical protein NQZ68_015091 [Dissostichus eleginoides]|nr:hypothetical protein NQZ68_015091 [Dissostichus eleginoides]
MEHPASCNSGQRQTVSRKSLPAARREVTERLRRAVTASTHRSALSRATARRCHPASCDILHHVTSATKHGRLSFINLRLGEGGGMGGGMSDVAGVALA